MKKKILKVLSLLLVATILCSSLSTTSLALTSNTQSIKVDYEKPGEIVAVEKQKEQLIISTKTASGKVNNFYITFPSDGGARFRADNEGIFKPSGVSEITYSGEETYDGEKTVVMQANDTKVKVYHKSSPWRVEVYNAEDELVVKYDSDRIYMGYEKTTKELRKVKIVSDIKENETLFGLGERFNGFVQNGKTVEMWNIDCLTQLSKSYGDHNVGYKNIPLLHSNQGYSVFHNNTYYGIVDVGEKNKEECSFEFYGPILDMYIWTGSSVDNIDKYHKLTGSSVDVPKWSLSYWAGQSSSVWMSNGKDLETVHETLFSRIDRYEEMNTPIKNVYAEGIAAKTKYLSIAKEMKDRGINYFGWMDSTYRSHDDDRSAGSIAKKALGENTVYRPLVQWNDTKRASWWTSDGAKWVDYTDPSATLWLKERFAPFFEVGIKGMMVDYNDKITVKTYYPYNQSTGDWMHNFSCYYYNKAVDTAYKDYYGKGNYINFARAACAGSHAYTAVFAGDQTADYMGFQQVVSGLLSSAASGIHIWGSDIGGMHKSSTAAEYDPELYARWLAFGTFSPLMRSHAQRGFTDPWEYDSNGSSEAMFQKYYWTRENIVDLVYGATIKTNKENVPMTQAMVIAYPEQTELAGNMTQYIFCDQLLVCPVTTERVAYIDVQFPEGRWVDLWDGSVYEGGQTIRVNAAMDKIPVYVKEGGTFPVTYGEDLDIGTINTVDKNVNALIVTPSEKKVENTYYVEEDQTETYVCDMSGEATYRVTSEAGSNKKVVTAMGAVADKVVVDGKELKELTTKPTSAAEEVGFYRDYENNSTIIVTPGTWKSIEYSDTEERMVNLALNAKVKTEGIEVKEEEDPKNIVDGSYDTVLSLNDKDDAKVVVDLKRVKEINKIHIVWSGSYSRDMVVEISTNGKDWEEVHVKKRGGGGIDKIVFDEYKECRYIRLSGFAKQGRRNPELAEVEVYGKEVHKMSDFEVFMNDIGTAPIIIGASVVGVLLVVGAVLVVIGIRKKRKLKK